MTIFAGLGELPGKTMFELTKRLEASVQAQLAPKPPPPAPAAESGAPEPAAAAP